MTQITSRPALSLRRAILARDGQMCQYCGDTGATHYIVEHIVPQRRGGPHHPANLVVACTSCNVNKGRRIWVPMNFDQITVEYPTWAAEVRSLAVLPGDKRLSGPMITTAHTLIGRMHIPTVSDDGKKPATWRVDRDLLERFQTFCQVQGYAQNLTLEVALTDYLDRQAAP